MSKLIPNNLSTANLLPKTLLAAALTMTFNGAAQAEDSKGFAGNGEFGYSSTSGNTESDSLYAALKLQYTRSADEILAGIEANSQSEDNNTTQERYLIDLQYNRYFSASKDFYGFVTGRFENNRFEGLDLDSTYSVGLGKQLFKNDAMSLKGEAGVGYQIVDFTQDFGGQTEEQAVIRGKLDYQYTINQNVDFVQDLIITDGSEQMKTEANTAVKVKLAEQMRLKAGFKYRHNSDPAAGADKVDTQTLLTLTYDF